MALREGVDAAHVVRFERYEATHGRVLLSGVQALARAVIDQRRLDQAAGLDAAGFVSGYPGSPLAGFDLELARIRELLEAWGVVHSPGLNEELAATAVAGSQLSLLQSDHTVEGVTSMWYGKAPGLDRASDAVRHGNLMGTGPTGGVLVAVGDDPSAKSSSVPSTSEPSLYSLGLPILSPADPQDLLDLALHGYALSRASGLWVGLRVPASVADATQSVRVDLERLRFLEPSREINGRPFTHRVTAQLLGPTLLALEGSLYGERLDMARRYAALNGLDHSSEPGPHDVLGVVAAGPAYLSVVHALSRLGIDAEHLASAGVRLLKLSVLYPLNVDLVREFANGLREVVVVEDKRGFIEDLVKSALSGEGAAARVVGKFDERGSPLIAHTGEVDPDAILRVLAARLALLGKAVDVPARPLASAPLSLARGPYFCAGCPHNTSVKLPEGSCVGSGSGCHGLVLQMAPRQVGTVVGRFQMGGEGAMWNGMSHFVGADHFFQNIGDGTFAHSGSLALRAAIAAKVNITYKLLVNSSVAMTGGQAVLGGRPLEELCRLLVAEGVARVVITTDEPKSRRYSHVPSSVAVRDRRQILEVQRELAATPGVTVLLHDQACATEKRRRQRRAGEVANRHVVINQLVCDGCGECGARTNCLSLRPVMTPWGPKTELHQESCALDLSCLDSPCPAFVTVDATASPTPHDLDIDPARLVEPTLRVPRSSFTVRLTGVGGTGVITLAQIVAWAAHLEGRHVRAMDQTGIAQKGGSVVSDVRVSEVEETSTFKLGASECDLYLGCEMLVAAEARNLVAASPARTVAVMSSSRVPTGRQVANNSLADPAMDEIRGAIDPQSRFEENLWLDAAGLSRRHLGSDVYANVVLLGAAFQHGTLPLPGEALERAIELNGVAVAENLRAFRLGRLAVAEPAAPELAPDTEPIAPASSTEAELLARSGVTDELAGIVLERLRDVRAYQNVAYAHRYLDLVAVAHDAETRVGATDGRFSTAVARNAHRLMTYRDEYEVARLSRDPAFIRDVAARFGEGAALRHQLLPPLLARFGRERKVAVAGPLLGGLARLRGVRGRAWDPFGHDELRRLERRVRDDYFATITQLAATLTPENLEQATRVAELPDAIRGYGQVKRDRLEAYQAQRRELVGAATSS